MESIVSLERGVCSCAELQGFSCYRGWKEACQETRAISITSRRELSSSIFVLQGKVLKEMYIILTGTLGEHAPSCATVKNWVAQFKRDDFFTCDAARLGQPKTVNTPEIIDKIYELILEDRLISAKSRAQQLGISRDDNAPTWCGILKTVTWVDEWLSNVCDFRNTVLGKRELLFSVCRASVSVLQNDLWKIK